MTKAIIMTIRPEHLVKILNGEKTIEIRKTIPKNIELPRDVYLYCSKGKPYLYSFADLYYAFSNDDCFAKYDFLLNGKVACKFTLNKIGMVLFNLTHWRYEVDANGIDLSIASCVSTEDIRVYLGNEHRRKGNPKYQSNKGYAYHIDNLVIFDKPKELNEFIRRNQTGKSKVQIDGFDTMNRVPQSWTYCWVKGETK